MSGPLHEASPDDLCAGAGASRGGEVAAPERRRGSPRFTRAYAEVVRDLLAGRYVIGDAVEWDASSRTRNGRAAIVGAGGPGLLLHGTEMDGAAAGRGAAGSAVSILILDPHLWTTEESFDAARRAAGRLATLRDPTLILPRRVLSEAEARCLVLVMDPLPPPPHRGPGEVLLDGEGARRAGLALCRAARTLAGLGEGAIVGEEVWFGADGQVRVLHVPGASQGAGRGAARGVGEVIGRIFEGAGVEPRPPLQRALERARSAPPLLDAAALDGLQRALSVSERRPHRISAIAALLAIVAAIVWLGTSFTWISGSEERVAVSAWGGERTLDPGLQLKWPVPLEVVRASRAHGEMVADVRPHPLLGAADEPAGAATPEPSADAAVAPAEEEEPAGHVEASAAATPAEEAEGQADVSEPAPETTDGAEAGGAEAAPFPAEILTRYFARDAYEQARQAVMELARLHTRLAGQRDQPAPQGDEQSRAAAAEALRLLAEEGVDESWLTAAFARLETVRSALELDEPERTLEVVDELAAEAMSRLTATAGAPAAGASIARAAAAEAAWERAPRAVRAGHEEAARRALAEIASGREVLASGDLPKAAEQLRAGAAALEQTVSEALASAARDLEQHATVLLEEWNQGWATLARAGFSAPEEAVLARERLETGRERLRQDAPAEAIRAFESAAELAEGRLAWLAEERRAAREADALGRSALHRAAVDGDVQRARYVLAFGAPADARDLLGASPLRLALENGRLSVARVLVEHGADVNQRGDDGRPLVFDSVSRPAAFLFLLDQGARAGWTIRGSTLLHEIAWARARHGVGDADQIKMAAGLLDRGADLTARDASGETPIQIAERTRATALADYLRKRVLFGREWDGPPPSAPPPPSSPDRQGAPSNGR